MDERGLLVERFINARRELRLNQKTTARILGVGQKAISDYEHGAPVPSIEMIEELERRIIERDSVLIGKGNASLANMRQLPVPERIWVLMRAIEFVCEKPVMQILDQDGRLTIILKDVLKKLLDSEKEITNV